MKEKAEAKWGKGEEEKEEKEEEFSTKPLRKLYMNSYKIVSFIYIPFLFDYSWWTVLPLLKKSCECHVTKSIYISAM